MLPLGQGVSTDVSLGAIPLFLKIRDNHPNIHHFAYYLEYLTFHLPPEKLEPALNWLIKNKITGQKFLDYVHGDCARSGLELIRNVTMRLEREKRVRALTAKDIQ